jgi:hypothetical protein
MKHIWIPIIAVFTLLGCKNNKELQVAINDNPGPAKVEVIEKEGVFQLMVNDSPYFINGAGLEFGNIKALAEHQGNSFRTWRTDNGRQSGKEVLDEAYANGLMVTMGIEVARERHGFRANY